MLDRLSDVMMFGALVPCKDCGGQYVFKGGVGYVCTGQMSEWTKCQNKTDKPKRKEFKLPSVSVGWFFPLWIGSRFRKMPKSRRIYIFRNFDRISFKLKFFFHRTTREVMTSANYTSSKRKLVSFRSQPPPSRPLLNRRRPMADPNPRCRPPRR